MAFGNHLGPDHDIVEPIVEIMDDFLNVFADLPHIRIDPANPGRREDILQFFDHPFGAIAGPHKAGGAALGADFGEVLDITAMVAFQHLVLLVVGQITSAGRADENVAAVGAHDVGPIATPVDQKENLLMLFEFFLDFLEERG
jgi:hypothetical protein